ncbi:hypothetical protein L5I01_17360 [Gordonia sp. HY442]|uniref:hypothetical protein n=1 Tax=Gordonia zhenghanii TaxID=2911516 RepID=UPI001F2756EF|nr:hypothetical protein [Gordonia zhenghanii]MCF8605125.1 hypothetical protein [Gordonia zhenghanii]
MSTDIAQFGGAEPSPFRVPEATSLAHRPDPMVRLREWAQLYVEIGTAAKYLAATDFVPAGLQGKPEAVAAAMMKGSELGIDPLDALQNIHVVKGKVGFAAEFMRRRIIEAGHEIRIKESTDARCVIQGRRKDSDEWQQVTFTAENARTAKIDISAYPADKLVARASSRLCRRVFPDVLGGSIIIEDVLDSEVVDDTSVAAATPVKAVEAAPIQRKSSPRKTAAKKAAPKREPAAAAGVNDPSGPPLPGDDEPASNPSAKPEPEQVKEVGQNSQGEEAITPAQNKMLHTLMTKEGLTERADAMAWLSENLKREITTSNDLSKTEASGLIDFLQNAQERDEKGDA